MTPMNPLPQQPTRRPVEPPSQCVGDRHWIKVRRKEQRIVVDTYGIPRQAREVEIDLIDVLVALNLSDQAVQKLLTQYVVRNLTAADAERAVITTALRRQIARESQYTCHWCRGVGLSNGRGPDGKFWNVDHVMPIKLGGDSNRENLVLACWTCNSRKGAQHPDDWRRQINVKRCRSWVADLAT